MSLRPPVLLMVAFCKAIRARHPLFPTAPLCARYAAARGPGNVTVLHAVVIGNAAAALPLLVAAGAKLDAAVELYPAVGQARDFLASLGVRLLGWLTGGYTALGMAVG